MVKSNILRQISIGFILAILLLAVLGYISYNNNKQYQGSSEWVAHTNKVLYHAQKALTLTLSIETGQRGYIITGDTLFLRPYYNAVANLPKHINDLIKLTGDSPNHQKRLDTLQVLVSERMDFAQETIRARNKNYEVARDISMTQKGQFITNEIRKLIADLEAEEEKLLNQHTQEQVALLQSYNNSSKALYLVMAIILFTLFALIYKNLRARTKAEILLKSSSEEIKDLYNNSPCGYLSSNVTGVIININDTLLRWIGYERREVINVLKFRDFLTESSRDIVDQKFTSFKVKGFVNDMRFDLVRKDGSIIHILLNSIAKYDAHGNYLKSRSSVVDISHIKLMEDQLREARQTAESANQTKGQFLANMSHEIRTPLNAVIGLSHLTLKTDLSEKQLDYVKKIQSSSESLLSIVNDILDFSKIESGKLTLEEVDFDLEEVFQKLADVITYKAQGKGLEIAFGIDSKVPTYLIGDPVRIEHILSNLCSNAVKFTEKGEVVVNVSLLEDSGDRLKLQFKVTDTGIGMDNSQIGKLFRPFSQADDSISRKYGGTGLGLSIIKRLVELMGGEVSVKSQPGKGSNFYFSIWLKTQKYQRKLPLPSIDLRRLSVLVVDDNKSALKILKEALESFSFKVIAIDSGIQAVHFLKINYHANPVQLVLMDWKMPGMDGLAAARIIRQDPNLAGTRIVMMCNSYCHESLYQDLEELGLSGVLTKPIRYSVLYDSIMGAINGGFSPPEKGRKKIQKDVKTASNGGHLLLVEDNEINQQVAIGLLEALGFTAEIAGNGLEAIDRVRNSGIPSKYHLVLMDIQMPVMGGYKATREIRKLPGYQDLPIIAMTADAMVGVQEKCLEAGMKDFITKPINPDRMLETIEKWIVRKNNIPETKGGLPLKIKSGPEKIPRMEGLNIEDGLSHLGGNTTLYNELLNKFLNKHENFIAELKNKISTGSDEEINRDIHTMKGMSGNLGMIRLHETCQKAEEYLKDDKRDKFNGILQSLESEMNIVLQALRKNLVKNLNPNHQITLSKVKPLVDQMESLVRDSDPGALKVLKEIGNVNGYEKQFQQVKKFLENYDFDKALEFLMVIKSQLNG